MMDSGVEDEGAHRERATRQEQAHLAPAATSILHMVIVSSTESSRRTLHVTGIDRFLWGRIVFTSPQRKSAVVRSPRPRVLRFKVRHVIEEGQSNAAVRGLRYGQGRSSQKTGLNHMQTLRLFREKKTCFSFPQEDDSRQSSAWKSSVPLVVAHQCCVRPTW